MTTISRNLLFVILLLISGLSLLSGCGGGNGSGGVSTGPSLQILTADPSKPSAIGGSLFSLANQIIDTPYNAVVTLTGTPDNPAQGSSFTQTTRSVVRGGYQFPSIPAGTYALTATATAAIAGKPDTTFTVTGGVSGIRAQGNIPSLMVNMLLGESSQLATVTGTITQDGQPAAGAVMTADVTAFDTSLLSGSQNPTSVQVQTVTAADGTYTFQLPVGGTKYFIAAHSATSQDVGSKELNSGNPPGLQAGQRYTVNLSLPEATTATLPAVLITADSGSTTLAEPTAAADALAMVTRLAIARALGASSRHLRRLQTMQTAHRRATRAITGFVENDLFWVFPTTTTINSNILGYDTYRSTVKPGPYYLTGVSPDPYEQLFYDNDPALQDEIPRYYTVTAYAAGGKKAAPSSPVMLQPLPQMTLSGPVNGASVTSANAVLSWTPLTGALSYVVLVFTNEPTLNSVPIITQVVTAGTSFTLTGQSAGTYWWGVTAYNDIDPNNANAGSYSAYNELTITP